MRDRYKLKELALENARSVAHAIPYFAAFWAVLFFGVKTGWIDVPARAGDVEVLTERQEEVQDDIEAIKRRLGSVDTKLGSVGKGIDANQAAIDKLSEDIESNQQTIIDMLLQDRER